MAVDDRDEQRARLVAAGHLVEVGTRSEQRLHCPEMALPRGEVQRRHAALISDEFVVQVLPIDARRLRPARLISAAASLRRLPAGGGLCTF